MKTIHILIAYLLLVSAVVSAAELKDNNDGTIIDLKTKLIWQKGEQGKMRWERAAEFCKQLKLAAGSNWRLPTKEELLSLTEKSMFNPSIDRRFFPDAKPEDYWTSTQGTVAVGSAAWLVNFAYGDTHFFNKSNEYFVRCVRK